MRNIPSISRRAITLIAVLAAFMLASGCQTSNVKVDYDTATDFNGLKYYQWANDVSDTSKGIDPLINARIKQATTEELHNSGFLASSEQYPADILVRYYFSSKVRTEDPSSRGSIGLGGGGGSSFLGIGLSIPLGSSTEVKDVEIIVDLLGSDDKKLKWRGSKNLKISDETPAEITTSINAAIAEIFSFYPPGAKK
ncbi:MAG: DUF4136 domain-containing protein [Spongiibacteraceae bacterium]